MVQMGQIVVHITTHPLPVLLIIRCPCTPYRGENYGTNRSDCHTSHNTASDSLAYYLVPLYTIQGRKLWYKWVRLSYISQHILCQSCLLSGAPVHHTGEKTMVQIGQIVIHLTIQPLTVLLIIWCPCTPASASLAGAPVHHTGEKTMVQIGQIVVHLTTQPLPVLLIIW